MKKTLVAVAALLAAILLLGPYALGRFAEQRSEALTQAAVAQMPYLKVVESSWDRSWFTSRQRVVLEATGLTAGGERERFTVHNDVLHGPLLGLSGIGAARLKTRMQLPALMAADLRETFGEEPALEATTRIGLTGGGSTVLKSRGRSIALPEGEGELVYETARVTIDFSRDLSRYEVDARMPRVEVRGGEGQQLVFDRFTIEGGGSRVAGFEYLYDSEIEAVLRELSLDGADGTMRIEDLRYATLIDTDDGFTDMSFVAGTGQIDSQQLAANDLEVRKVHYDVSLQHLHAPSVDAFYTSMQQVYLNLPADEGADPEAADAALRAGFIEPLMMHVGAVLERGARLSFERVGFDTQHGEARLTGNIQVPGITEQQFQSEGVAGLIGRLEADFSFEIALELAQRLPNGQMLTGPGIGSGYLVQEDDKLVSHIQYRRGTLTVNGQTQAVPLPGLAPGEPQPAPGAGPDEALDGGA